VNTVVLIDNVDVLLSKKDGSNKWEITIENIVCAGLLLEQVNKDLMVFNIDPLIYQERNFGIVLHPIMRNGFHVHTIALMRVKRYLHAVVEKTRFKRLPWIQVCTNIRLCSEEYTSQASLAVQEIRNRRLI